MVLSYSSPPHRTVLTNEIVVLSTFNPTVDIIAARLFLRAGSCCEPPDRVGLASLLAAVLTKGTDTLSSLEIAERVEYVGAGLGTDAANDYFLLSLKTVSADFVDVLILAAELLRQPSFPVSEVNLEKRLMIQAIASQQEQPFAIAFDQLRSAMYHDHPYAHSPLGKMETVAKLSREDLQQFHHAYFRPDNLVISISGRIEPDTAFALVERIFGDWQIPAQPLPKLVLQEVTSAPHVVKHQQETQQSIVMLGYLAPAVQQSDYAIFKLLTTYLGNGMSSRLFVELREKKGLAYEVSAVYPTRAQTSFFTTYLGTAPTNTAIAIEGLQYEVDRLKTTKLVESEIESAKNKLLGQYALGKQTNAQLSQLLGWYETLGLSPDFDRYFQQQIASVTPAEIQSVAHRYFDRPFVSLVGPHNILEILESSGNAWS